MKNILIIITIFACFLFSFTLLQNEDVNDKEKENKEKTEVNKDSQDFQTDIDERLKEIDKLDFSKIKESPKNTDFDAHADLD